MSEEVEPPTDVFAVTSSYISLTLKLAEPLYKEANFENIKADASSIVVKFPEAKKFPSTRDAITTFESAVDYIIG